MPIDRIPLTELATRRKKVLTALKGAVGLVCAGRGGGDDAFRPHPHFTYLTGVAGEPGAMLLLDPTNPVPDRRAALLMEPLNPEREQWDGYRREITRDLRDQTGFETIYRVDMLPRLLRAAAARSRRLACLHPTATISQPVSPDLDLFRKVVARQPGTSIEDRSDLLDSMRAVKSPNELALMQRAVDITAEGFAAGLAAMRPGLGEDEIQRAIEDAYRTHGSRSTAFRSIVGSGRNSTVLHYVANDQVIADGTLVCIDSGAMFGGYAADVTRTVPANGRFTDRQREIYEIVLAAETAAIEAVKPGATWAQLDDAARKIITGAGYGDFFIHSIGHHLGLETHDASPDEPLKQGAVITIEPGIYLPDEALGVRIEDDVLVTQQGHKVLTAKIPKKVGEVETALKRE